MNRKTMEHIVAKRFDEGLRATPQNPRYHGEGDVFSHTRMVYDALSTLPEYVSLPEDQQTVLALAAILHDVGKITTTREENGEYVSPNHAAVGSHMAREMLWAELGMCGSEQSMRMREAICLLVRHHTFPPYAIYASHASQRLHKIASNGLVVPDFSIEMLCMLARADMLGRISEDKQQMLDRIALCEEMAREEQCLEGCYDFADAHLRRAYMKGAHVWKGQQLYDDTWGEVVLMSGLPGTGKDTWIARNLPDMPMVSLDEIRRARKIAPTAKQGKVANLAREQAKEYLRQHQPFVWNATNLTEKMRESLVGLFETYHARVRIVYLETDWETLMHRNLNREYPVPEPVIRDMLGKLTPPAPYEAHSVEWLAI